MRVKGHTARGVVGKVIRTGLFTSVGMAGLLAGAPAWADSSVCETTGDVTLFACSASVTARVESGDTSLTVDGANITDGNINYNTWNGTTAGQIDMALEVNNSVVNSTDYGGINMYTAVADGANVQVTLGEDVSITSSAGFGGVWVKNELAGDITIDSDADLTVSGTETNGIAATTNAGSVHITNSGTITVQETANAAAFTQRGIYADGGFNNAEPVEVTVTNSGTVNAQAAGIRAVNYNGLAKIQNSGTVASVNNQALVAWTPNGKVVIINDETGNASSDTGPAIQGASQIGDISITNDGIASGVIGINAIAGFDENEPGNGDITIDNTGTLTALGGTGIYAWTPEGDVTLTNAGSVESDQQGVSLDSLDGTVSITNSGSITGAYGIVTNDAATKIVNSGKIESTDISGNAILMGTGDVTLELHAGAEIIGSIADADPLVGTNALVLGGDSDGSFDAGQIAQYEGFSQFDKTGDSTWTLTGTGSTGWTIEEGTLTATSGAAFGVDQAYVVNGGSLDIAGTTASIASLGGTADGTVNIGTGGKLTLNQGAAGSYAGQFTGSGSLTKAGSGTLTLTGDSSAFTGYLYLTEGATVIDGDTMGAGVVFLGSIDEPTLTVQNGGVLDAANVIVGNSTNNALPGIEDESGSLTVTGSQSTLNADFLTVGYYGDGSLTIADGGKVVSDSVISVGAVEGSTGTITISGEDSQLEGGSLQFGGSGTGVLNLSGGATMETTSGGFGVNAGASGTGTISGEGTRWDITQSSLTIGSAGEGILSVTEGAVVHAASGDVKLGSAVGGKGKLTVSGAGSSVTTATNFVIGSYGSGNVSVDSGAEIGGANLIVGFVDGSDGVLDVSGAGTLAKGNSYVMVGTYAGSSGAITLSDDATLKADGNRGITLAYEAGSTGTLNIGAAAGDSAAAAGTIDAVKGIQFGGGAGTLVLNHTDSDYEMTADISGSGVINVLAGTTAFAGDGSNYTGALNVKGGKLVLANTTGAASTTIDADGTLQIGNGGTVGSLNSDILNNGQLIFDRADGSSYEGDITGQGAIVKAGLGTTTLSGDSSAFAGTTTLEGGTVLVTGKLGGEVVIQSQGTLQIGNGLKDGDLLGDTTNDGTLIFNQVSDYDYAGALSGNGSLIKKGEGSLLLSGDYSYTGSTIVEGGLVRLAALLDSDTDLVLNSGTFDLDGKTQEVSGLSGLAGTLLLGTGSLNVRQQWDSVFGGIISGNVPGSFTKSGTGSLNLTGASTFTGLVNVIGGRLAINGTLPGAVSVFGGATLGGTGTAGSVTVQDGGTLAPGNSIGTLTTIGDVLFEDGSVYEVEVNAQGDSDKLLVGGKATIEGGTVSVLAAAGNYRWNSDYVIISAADGVTGQFDDTDVDLPFLTPYLRYDLNDVVLTLGRNDRSFASVAGTPNQLAVAAALDASDQNASLPRAVAGQIEEAGAVRAFDALSGELWATTGTLMVDRSRRLGEMVVSRLEQADSMSASHSMADRQTRDGQTTIWGQGIGAWNTLKSDGNAATATQSSYGFITGIDTLLGDWRLGVAFSHGKDEVQIDGRSSEATVEGSSVAAYIGGGWGQLHTRIGATYSWLDVTGSRGVEFPGVSETLAGGYDAKSASAFGEISYAFPLGGAIFEPFAGVNHVHLKSDAFTESGSALSALGVDESTRDVTYTMLGLRLGGAKPLSEGTMIVPRASAAWLHSFGDTEAISRHTLPTGKAFSIAGLPTKRDTLQVEAGLQVNILPGGSIGATYIGNIGDQWKDHGVKLGFSYSF